MKLSWLNVFTFLIHISLPLYWSWFSIHDTDDRHWFSTYFICWICQKTSQVFSCKTYNTDTYRCVPHPGVFHPSGASSVHIAPDWIFPQPCICHKTSSNLLPLICNVASRIKGSVSHISVNKFLTRALLQWVSTWFSIDWEACRCSLSKGGVRP